MDWAMTGSVLKQLYQFKDYCMNMMHYKILIDDHFHMKHFEHTFDLKKNNILLSTIYGMSAASFSEL